MDIDYVNKKIFEFSFLFQNHLAIYFCNNNKLIYLIWL